MILSPTMIRKDIMYSEEGKQKNGRSPCDKGDKWRRIYSAHEDIYKL